jgi:endonuclease I
MALAAVLVLRNAAYSQPPFDAPPGYYDSVEGLTGADLHEGLHEIVDGDPSSGGPLHHIRRAYSELYEFLPVTDGPTPMPDHPALMLLLYSNRLIVPESDWQREHSWPSSYGFPEDSACNFPFTDLHHIFPEQEYNQSRSNRPFDDCAGHAQAGCVSRPADGHDAEYGNWYRVGGPWEVWHNPDAQPGGMPVGRRGDIARAMFYMDLRYEGDENSLPACSGQFEPDLRLTDDLTLVVTTTTSPGYMGRLATLCAWADQDPVDLFERRRNALNMTPQANRNPFVDHPEWTSLYCSQATTATPSPSPTLAEGGGGEPATATPTPVPPLEVVYLPYASRTSWTRPPTATSTATRTSRASMTPTLPHSTAEPTRTHTSQPPPPSPTPTDAPGQLVVSTLRCSTSDEMVQVSNVGGSTTQLSGWEILSVVGSQLFVFPTYSLQPGTSVEVHSGEGAPPTGGPIFRWTLQYIWNNEADSAELRDPDGALVDARDC